MSLITEYRDYTKWKGLFDLREAGLHVPNAVFFEPGIDLKAISQLVMNFMNMTSSQLIALRADGGKKIFSTPSGINFDRREFDKIMQKIYEWNSHGFGVVMLETHSKFDYEFCCNCVLSADGSFILEFVGPGFDGGDLNKALLLPSLIVKSRQFFSVLDYSDSFSGEANLESLNHLYFRVDIESRPVRDDEIDSRLKYLASKLLPDMGIKIANTRKAAEEWLLEHGETKLLSSRLERFITFDDLKEIVLSVSRYCHFLIKNGRAMRAEALTMHKYDGKIIFFGTYNSDKWGGVNPKTS